MSQWAARKPKVSKQVGQMWLMSLLLTWAWLLTWWQTNNGSITKSKYAKKTEANKKPVNVLSVIFCSSDSSEDVKDDPESDDELEVDDK